MIEAKILKEYPTLSKIEINKIMSDVFINLPERSQYIFMERDKGTTLGEIGRKFDISRERVRQLEAKFYRRIWLKCREICTPQ